MKKKKKFEKILMICLASIIIFSISFGVFFFNESQIFLSEKNGYYSIYDKDEHIGNIKDISEIQTNMKKKYGAKAELDLYLGDNISIEYFPTNIHNETINFIEIEKLMEKLDVTVEALSVKAFEGGSFYVTSYSDWNDALAEVILFVGDGAAQKAISGVTIKGDVKIADSFMFEYQKIPIDLVKDSKQIQQELMYGKSDEKQMVYDIIQSEDTIAKIATRHNISTAQLEKSNAFSSEQILVPGAKVNVTKLNYAVSFAYPVIEDIIEDIAYEIEYIDNPDLLVENEEIIQAGVNGKAVAQYISNIVNGESITGQRLQYEVLEQPTKQIISKGTKIKPVAPSESASGGVKTDAPYANEAGFIWPTIGICISAEYGWYEYGAHKGLDIAGRSGEAVWAAADGTVESAGYYGAFGNQVLISHSSGLKTRYAHLKAIGVNKGQKVKQGEYIGSMGSTGMSEANHLHFEVHANGERLNPRGYLPPGGKKSC
ncbi:metalloendopeptidase [Erysipelotrichaceae bacterium]|nr:metalloendopeptidase [Erysipelotrichaceae bacterium]